MSFEDKALPTGLEQLRVPGMKMRVMLGPKFCRSVLASKAVRFEVQTLRSGSEKPGILTWEYGAPGEGRTKGRR